MKFVKKYKQHILLIGVILLSVITSVFITKYFLLTTKEERFESTTPNQNAISDVITNDIKICEKDDDCNLIYSGNICKSDGRCHCSNSSGILCQYGPLNYKDPNKMTPQERDNFKSFYGPNMTVQDYRNWLSLYRDDLYNLSDEHIKNYEKIKNGIRLEKSDLPKYKSKPPVNVGDYFGTLWNNGNVAIAFPINSETGPYLASNIGDYKEFVPPEEGIGQPILANQEERVDPYELDYLIRPRVTTGAERTEIGRRYQQRQEARKYNRTDVPVMYNKLDDPQTVLGEPNPLLINPTINIDTSVKLSENNQIHPEITQINNEQLTENTPKPGLRMGQQSNKPGLRLGQQSNKPGLRLGHRFNDSKVINGKNNIMNEKTGDVKKKLDNLIKLKNMNAVK